MEDKKVKIIAVASLAALALLVGSVGMFLSVPASGWFLVGGVWLGLVVSEL